MSRLYPLWSYDGTVDGKEPGTSFEQFDVEGVTDEGNSEKLA